MNKIIENHLNIRYAQFRFTLRFVEDSRLPVQKTSAIRGGMGEMLLRMNCIADRHCESCSFEDACIVRKAMYSKMKIQPSFMQSGDSVGYVMECDDHREQFEEGDTLCFDLLLLGDNIVLFSQYLLALQHLGFSGLGKNHALFEIVSIINTDGEDILDDQTIDLSKVKVKLLSDYVRASLPAYTTNAHIRLRTPLTVKYHWDFIHEFNIEAVLAAAERRIYILNCFEGNEIDRIDLSGHVPTCVNAVTKNDSVVRYSNTHDKKIMLRGIRGEADLTDIDETAWTILKACEILHIGKNTSFGFGGYELLVG